MLGIALGGADQISPTSSVASLGSFLAGAAFGWTERAGQRVIFELEACLLGLSAVTTAAPLFASHSELTVSLLALASTLSLLVAVRRD